MACRHHCQVASVMSDSVRPHRRQPTRPRRPWDCPGKNTGVGCHFLLQCMKVKSESEVAQSCPILSDLMDCSPPGSSVHGICQARVLEWGAIAFSPTLPRPSLSLCKHSKPETPEASLISSPSLIPHIHLRFTSFLTQFVFFSLASNIHLKTQAFL